MYFTDLNAASKAAKELFMHKGVKAEDKANAEAVREAFARCYETVMTMVPPGRYQATAKTHLETAALLATKAFTHAE